MNINNDISSCKKATVLMSKSLEKKLSLKEKSALAAHLAICKTCCFCFKQLKTIKETIARYADVIYHLPISDKHTLSNDVKKRIKEKIDEEIG
jgi:hypothetical protein